MRSSSLPLAAGCGAAAGAFGACGACAGAGFDSWFVTSWTLMRPIGSFVWMADKSMPFSRANLRAAGVAIGPLPGLATCSSRRSTFFASPTSSVFVSAGAGAVSVVASAFVFVATAVPPPDPELRRAITCPTWTVSPSAANCSSSVPDSSAGTSILTLSVSSSTMASPFSTWSPGCLSHDATVPSVMDSANSGTLISITMSSPLTYLRSFWYVLVPAAAETASREMASRMIRACSCLWAVGFPSAGLERRRRPT